MAFYDDQEEDKQELEGQAPQPQQSGIISGQGAVADAAGATPAPDKPGNFVGIQTYLDANKTQAGKLGDQVAGNVQSQVDTARGKIGALQGAAQDQIKAIDKLDDQTTTAILENPEGLTEEERIRAREVSQAQYTGPNNVTEFGDVYGNTLASTQKAQQQLNDTRTEEGRMGLITQVNDKQRTQGMNVFDNALLSAGGGREKLANVAANNATLGQELSSVEGSINEQALKAKEDTALAQQEAYRAIQDSMTKWREGFDPKTQAARDKLTGLQTRIATDLDTDPLDFDEETLSLLGLNPGDRLYDINLNDYIEMMSPDSITNANVATAEDYARYLALADMAGISPEELRLKNEDLGLAGTALTGPSINTTKLKEDLGKKDQAYQNAYSNQREGVLNNSYLINPNAAGGYAASIPGALTDRRDLNSATPQEIESFWIPLFRQAQGMWGGSYGRIADAMAQSVSDWKSNQFYNSQVTKNPKDS